MTLIPLTAHPSPSVAARGSMIAAGGGVAVLDRCAQGAVAKVRGATEPVYTVRIGPAGAACECPAVRCCSHVYAAALTVTGITPGTCGAGEDGCCPTCGRVLNPEQQRARFDALLNRMSRT